MDWNKASRVEKRNWSDIWGLSLNAYSTIQYWRDRKRLFLTKVVLGYARITIRMCSKFFPFISVQSVDITMLRFPSTLQIPWFSSGLSKRYDLVDMNEPSALPYDIKKSSDVFSWNEFIFFTWGKYFGFSWSTLPSQSDAAESCMDWIHGKHVIVQNLVLLTKTYFTFEFAMAIWTESILAMSAYISLIIVVIYSNKAKHFFCNRTRSGNFVWSLFLLAEVFYATRTESKRPLEEP